MNPSPEAGTISLADRPRGRSIRTFLIGLVLACLVPGMVGAGFLLVRDLRNGRAQVERDTIQTTRALVQTVDSYITRAETVANTLAAASPSIGQGNFALFQQQARAALAAEKIGGNIALMDRTGQQLVNTLRDFGQPLPKTGNIPLVERVFATGRPAISDLFIGGVLQRPVMSVAVPVWVGGKMAYVLTFSIQPEQFTQILRKQSLPEGRVAAVFDSRGTIAGRTHEPEKFVGRQAPPEFLQQIARSPEGALDLITLEGIPVRSHYSISPVSGWGVAIGIPDSVLKEELLDNIVSLALGLAILFSLGLGLAWAVGGRIAHGVRSLKAPAAALGSGRRLALERTGIQEAEEVARALGEAERILLERTARLQQTTARLELLFEHAPVAIAVFDRDMRYVAVSRRWLADHRLPEGNIIGRSHYDVVPDLPPAWKEAHRRGLAGEVLGAEMDPFPRADGSLQWVSWEIWPWRDDGGKLAGIVIVAEEVSERKKAQDEIRRLHGELEQRVEERTAELLAANRELEAFTFATSHDLKGPLGRINSFSTLLERNYRERLEGDGLLFLDIIRQNAIRLAQLVDDLLAHARVAQQDLDLHELDIAAAVAAVVREKADDIRDNGTEIRLQVPPARVLGDSHALGQALGNLLENALKYSSRVAAPRVEIAGESRGDRFCLWIRDNGIGFKMEYHDRIFKIFHRLHTHAEYRGSGVGLALVRRAMERMGGKVWAESFPGEGATFFLELPLAGGTAEG